MLHCRASLLRNDNRDLGGKQQRPVRVMNVPDRAGKSARCIRSDQQTPSPRRVELKRSVGRHYKGEAILGNWSPTQRPSVLGDDDGWQIQGYLDTDVRGT